MVLLTVRKNGRTKPLADVLWTTLSISIVERPRPGLDSRTLSNLTPRVGCEILYKLKPLDLGLEPSFFAAQPPPRSRRVQWPEVRGAPLGREHHPSAGRTGWPLGGGRTHVPFLQLFLSVNDSIDARTVASSHLFVRKAVGTQQLNHIDILLL